MTVLAANKIRRHKLHERAINSAPVNAGSVIYVGAYLCREAATGVVIPGADASGLVPLGVVIEQSFPDDPDGVSLTAALDNTDGADGSINAVTDTFARCVAYDQRGEYEFIATGSPKVGGVAYLVDDNTVGAAATTYGVVAGVFTRPGPTGSGYWFVDIGRRGQLAFAAGVSAPAALTDSTGETPNSTIADVSTAVTGVDGTASNAASKADVDTRLNAINENFSDLAAKVNALRTALISAGVLA